MSDQHGSADYRRHLTGVLTRRAVHKALKDRHDAASG
jgi:CO/xanthine dehydrogenase FAD-binding subunit